VRDQVLYPPPKKTVKIIVLYILTFIQCRQLNLSLACWFISKALTTNENKQWDFLFM
jgi:hypothetical protein